MITPLRVPVRWDLLKVSFLAIRLSPRPLFEFGQVSLSHLLDLSLPKLGIRLEQPNFRPEAQVPGSLGMFAPCSLQCGEQLRKGTSPRSPLPEAGGHFIETRLQGQGAALRTQRRL